MDETVEALKALQDLDQEIASLERRVAGYQPQLEELEAPVRELEQETETVRKRLEEMRSELRRLERGAEDKRAQLRRREERLQRVRTEREEAAARTEIDLVRGAAEADEQDALALMDQTKRTELKLDELETKLENARAGIAARREELLEARQQTEDELEVLHDRRENQKVRLSSQASRLYERVRGGRTTVVLASLTPDGACGHCFSMVPIQAQNEIRQARQLHRCEACGVILYSEE